ncbi:MAG: hypothetical protein A3D24_01735 [Candidatus Blackburnbacteria bacterium RIFCSPHIGHO2_02_FULL_39_13]|uniref:Glycosyltransferase 2-like domain-containing protein n=1 Tax=Candidatus Blackburnbacteria bacterium RIFCSPLOWO2_01_FULL_40_20 TaxID=1797519 RepID=A0A1G1VC39_9BACT|nr:MAG: Glycosyl transferase, family 2 [Microgenomates group bacterium GW2011_GWA2_39_19]OGY06840.1 MAG: hypothetical protein A2694_00785 [Candidatus Blackburnbacteria bacterium RIFCSPHIGHO2_01_FULL_40_17]OGY07941.1 MAG: hypothetical protein A3D24_01735 [Candidatus Blackburnbacteria bacterium RIFCSPHIGHO2_02_FULL_39_13]OGY12998.1 MAG: hypothetical protein A3A77_01640 [Candidatus Blackburnbacteria bacterium RIFCSPLOWO2_01_FULL_40_20]HBL51767.1 hypothetical protein [Candidatus Blackburnbacteria b
MDTIKTSVVIPNWNGRQLLEKNLPSVVKCGFDEIIIVDDASPDNSNNFLAEKFPEVKIVKHSKNMGFVDSVNDGVTAASGDIVFLLNLDVYPTTNIIRPVLDNFKKDEKVFAVSLHEKGYGWAKPALVDGYVTHIPGIESKETHKSFWPSGGSSAFRKKLWDELGGFDENLTPFYWEDLEIGLRATKHGYKILWEPKATVVHEHEAIINPKYFNRRWLNWIKDRNQLLVIWKHFTLKELLVYHLPGLLKRLAKPGYWVVFLMALLRLPGVFRGRTNKKRKAIYSYEQIVESF